SAKAAFTPFSGAAGYITSKAAVWAFISALAAEYKDDGIRANAILPSVIDTPGNRESLPDSSRKGWVSPESIAETVAFLVSDASAALPGEQVRVPGVGCGRARGGVGPRRGQSARRYAVRPPITVWRTASEPRASASWSAPSSRTRSAGAPAWTVRGAPPG